MKRTRLPRLLAAVLAMLLMVTMFAACGGTASVPGASSEAAPTPEASSSKPAGSEASASVEPEKIAIEKELDKGAVELVMYLVCDPQQDQEVVWEAVNQKLAADIKTTVTIKNIPWADFLQKYQLLFASGEAFDCAFAGNFCNYSNLAGKNAFLPLTEDMIKTYAPRAWEDMDPGFLKGSMVNGNIYMVPANQHDVRGSLAAIRGDLAQKYNLTVTNLDDFYNYLVTISENEKITAFNNDPENTSWWDETFTRDQAISSINVNGNNINTFDAQPKVFNVFETEAFLNYARKMRELNVAGVFPKSMLSSKEESGDLFVAGMVASHLDTWTGVYQKAQQAELANSEWAPQIVDITNYDKPLSDLSPSDAGIVLNPGTQYPERVLMMLDCLRQDIDLQDLTYLGIEKTHWTAPDDTSFEQTEYGMSAYQYNANCPWGWGNSRIWRVDASIPKDILTIRDKWLGIKQDSVAVAFMFDDTNVKTEEAAVSNVLAKYFNFIIYGFAEDTEGTIAKMNSELKTVGLDKIHQETQAQLDAFVAR